MNYQSSFSIKGWLVAARAEQFSPFFRTIHPIYIIHTKMVKPVPQGFADMSGLEDGASKAPPQNSSGQMAPTPTPPMKPVNSEGFRVLMGMPKSDDYDMPSFWSLWCPGVGGTHPSRERSIYYTLIDEERGARCCYRVVDLLVYACMLAQLAIASILVILGATEGDHHIAVAVLGAVTGGITGILSLIKGQASPCG